jgi:hypothetical protein
MVIVNTFLKQFLNVFIYCYHKKNHVINNDYEFKFGRAMSINTYSRAKITTHTAVILIQFKYINLKVEFNN